MPWFLALLHDKDLLEATRMQRAPHKTRIKEEDGQMQVTKNCTSNRMATAIKIGSKNMCDMYFGERGDTISKLQQQCFGRDAQAQWACDFLL